jgi:hypothetical protein
VTRHLFAVSIATTSVIVGLALFVPDLAHWFVIPLWLCGLILGGDAVDWLLGRIDRFDPRGIIGVLGIHLFFLAPLLHVCWEYWMPYVTPPADWRDWLGAMAIINAIGLVAYRFSLRLVRPNACPDRSVWVLNPGRFMLIAGMALIVSGGLQAWAYARYGGIIGYMETATDLSTRNSMQGMGMIYMISESFPIVALMMYAAYARQREWCRSWYALVPVLCVFLALAMLFGGLRGQRSNTAWNLFWAAGIIHFWIRPISLKLVAMGGLFLLPFMYAYGLYKGAGIGAIQVLSSSDAHEELAIQTGRTFDGIILGDFGRSDVHAFLLYRLMSPESDYEYGLGRTYVAAVLMFVPKSVWPDRPHHKAEEGTNAQFGKGSFIPEYQESSRVYGLAGETMLNFGPLLVPPAFMVWGLGVAWLRRYLYQWRRNDPRFLLYPYLVNFAFQVLILDFDNLLFFLIKYGAVPFAVVWLSSERHMRMRMVAGGGLKGETCVC